ncbi:DUF819 domain-containing protein [Streptomyces xiaopingdaonensis]|uniref:DUF819 family protein n=1 Tax=Streptomyces xiaopingdaonensis TaxID=1565415 RepID=UPI0002D8CEC6|nr:DUF819 family protein [Streptomyces xiaopingdaonensis]
MITDGFLYLGVLLALAACIVYLTQRRNYRVFRYVPGFVLLYLGAALLNTVGVFGDSESVEATGTAVQDALLPAMILLLLFQCDLRQIVKLGPKLLLTFFVASLGIVVGFVVTYLVFKAWLHPEAHKALGALAGSWTGGSANMVAVQGIVHAPERIFGYVLIVDTVLYSLWLLLMFGSVGFSGRFNRWTRADTTYLDTRTDADTEKDEARKAPIDLASLMALIGFSLFASALATWLGGQLPELGAVVNSTTWAILFVSVLGLVIASTPLGRTAGSSELAVVMLYVIVGIIASESDFSSLTEAPLYLAAGVVVLLVHLGILAAYAKLARVELFSLAVASTANVGGIASAPVVASAFNRQLVPVGVLFALMGSFIGTFTGLTTVQILSAL